MSIFFKIYSDLNDRGVTGLTNADYLTARANTSATSASSTSLFVGQRLITNYDCAQGFLQFDLSAVPAGGTSTISMNVVTAAPVAGDTLEVHQAATSSNRIAGASIAALPLLGSMTMPATTGAKTLVLTGAPSRSATSYLLLSGGKENTGTPPTGDERCVVSSADTTGTTNDPYIQIIAGTAWAFVGAGTSVEATATTHTLTEPAGVAAGDLLVACIGSRIASTTQITLPSGWTRVGQQLNNNTAATTSATPSGMMAYIVRGASAPALTFTHPVAPNVALGRVIAYRNVDPSSPFDVAVSVTGPTAVTSATIAGGITTTQDDDLVVGMTVGGQEGTWSNYNTSGITTSTGTADSVLDPIWGQFLERSDVLTGTGADMSLAIFDGVKQTAGNTVSIGATTTQSAANVNIAGAFKLAPPAPTGTTYNETVAETAAAAETLAVLEESKVRETEAADWRETESGAIRITEGLFVSPPIEETVAESASAADTVSAERSFICAVAENAGANETSAITLLRIGALAESAAATDTATGLLTRIGAVAETAAAAETTDASIVPAAGIFDVLVVETAPVVDSTDTSAIFTRAIAESASAAETISKTLTLTAALAETAAAADTIGGLAVRAGAVAETATAAETTTGLLTRTVAVAESASAAETITYNVAGSYNEAQLETAAAAETLTVQLAAIGAVAEAASAFETTTRTVSYTRIVAETAAAADTAGGLRVIVGVIAESTSVGRLTEAGDWRETEAGVPRGTASTIETVGGVLTGAVAIVESAAAAETITYSLTGAAGTVYNVTQAETAAAAETIAGPMIRVGAIAETASAAETIGKTLSYTKAVAETATAVETITRTLSYSRTVAETASAAETTTGRLTSATAIAETAAAADAIGATVIPLARIIDVTVAESASAADTLTVQIRRWIKEPPPWAAWVEEATAQADWIKTAPVSASWTRQDAGTGDWLLETRPVNRWTKE